MPLPPLDQIPEAVAAAARRALGGESAPGAWWETFGRWLAGGGLLAALFRWTQLRNERAQASVTEATAEDMRVATAGKVATYYRELMEEIQKMRSDDAARYERRIADDREHYKSIIESEKQECADRIAALQHALDEMNEKGRALERRVDELEGAAGVLRHGETKGQEVV